MKLIAEPQVQSLALQSIKRWAGHVAQRYITCLPCGRTWVQSLIQGITTHTQNCIAYTYTQNDQLRFCPKMQGLTSSLTKFFWNKSLKPSMVARSPKDQFLGRQSQVNLNSRTAWAILWVLGKPELTYIVRPCLNTQGKKRGKLFNNMELEDMRTSSIWWRVSMKKTPQVSAWWHTAYFP